MSVGEAINPPSASWPVPRFVAGPFDAYDATGHAETGEKL